MSSLRLKLEPNTVLIAPVADSSGELVRATTSLLRLIGVPENQAQSLQLGVVREVSDDLIDEEGEPVNGFSEGDVVLLQPIAKEVIVQTLAARFYVVPGTRIKARLDYVMINSPDPAE